MPSLPGWVSVSQRLLCTSEQLENVTKHSHCIHSSSCLSLYLVATPCSCACWSRHHGQCKTIYGPFVTSRRLNPVRHSCGTQSSALCSSSSSSLSSPSSPSSARPLAFSAMANSHLTLPILTSLSWLHARKCMLSTACSSSTLLSRRNSNPSDLYQSLWRSR